MDYLKSVNPSQLVTERGSNLVVINPGSANIKIGLASQDSPFIIPHCIAWYTTQVPKRNVQDQMLNSQVTTAQHMERERAYDVIASLLRIPFLDEEVVTNYHRTVGRIDGHVPQSSKKDMAFTWTDVYQNVPNESFPDECSVEKDATNEFSDPHKVAQSTEHNSRGHKYKQFICGEEALMISPKEPYCLRRPIRRGHLNISQYYPTQQVLEDLHAIWEWVLTEKMHIPLSERHMYSAVLIVPETFDNREVKEIISVLLRDLQFSSAVVHQEGLSAVFGNGLPTACVVNMGAQITSVVCIEDGAALPTTEKTLPFGGEDISRCLLWTQRHHQTWPQIRTDPLAKPIDLLMLNKLKELYCQIKVKELQQNCNEGIPYQFAWAYGVILERRVHWGRGTGWEIGLKLDLEIRAGYGLNSREQGSGKPNFPNTAPDPETNEPLVLQLGAVIYEATLWIWIQTLLTSKRFKGVVAVCFFAMEILLRLLHV